MADERDPLIQTRLPKETMAWVKAGAAEQGETVAAFVRRMLVRAANGWPSYAQMAARVESLERRLGGHGEARLCRCGHHVDVHRDGGKDCGLVCTACACGDYHPE